MLLKPTFQREMGLLQKKKKSLTWFTYTITKSVNLKLRKNTVRWHTCQNLKTLENNDCAKYTISSAAWNHSVKEYFVVQLIQMYQLWYKTKIILAILTPLHPWFPSISKYNPNFSLVIFFLFDGPSGLLKREF